MSSLSVFTGAANKKAAQIKLKMNEMKTAAKKHGVSDQFGKNGPLAKLGMDLVLNKEDDDLLDIFDNNNTDMANRYRKAFRKAYRDTAIKKDATLTDRMDSLSEFFGSRDSQESFERLMESVVAGKTGNEKAILKSAQNSSELKRQIKDLKNNMSSTGPMGITQEMVEVLKQSGVK